MKLIYSLLFFVLIPFSGTSQVVTLIAPLQDSIKETSGLIFLNQKIITHNDSGGESILYELDSVTGDITRSVFINNSINVDWEDICYDDIYIYIADFGNNSGSRTDLKVYRIPILDYFTTPNDTVVAEAIDFNYSDQTDFTPAQFSTNFDAEAIIAWNDSLYIFTKNWGNNWTNIYSLPKTLGSHQIDRLDSINSQGLVTGASYNIESDNIMLSGYTFSESFVIEISDLNSSDFSNVTIDRHLLQLPNGYSFQIEGIAFINQSEYYLSSEDSFSGSSGLFKLNFSVSLNVSTIDQNACVFYPNPVSDVLTIEYDDFSSVEIYNMNGALEKASTIPQIRISDLNEGMYVVFVRNSNGDSITSRITVVK